MRSKHDARNLHHHRRRRVGGLVAGFDQAKANPDADNFFESTSSAFVD